METKKEVAYAVVHGSKALQYKLVQLHIEDDIVIDKIELGNPDLKAIVVGRLMKRLARL